jgi:hypothetical protein
MTGALDAGVAGGILAIAFAAVGNTALSLTPVPGLYRESCPTIAAWLTLVLACLGAAAGSGLVRLVNRRTAAAPAANSEALADPPSGAWLTSHPR